MIRAVCLNPVIDRTYYIDQFTAGRQYKNNEPSECVGGKGVNVAKVCAQLGEPAAVYGFVGGTAGGRVRAEMARCCSSVCLLEVAGETRTTINVIDRSQNLETEILEMGPSVVPAQAELLLCRLEEDLEKGDIVVCSGISIPGAPEDIYVRIGAMCEKAGAMCILDANGATLRNAAEGRYYLCKPNQNELAELCGEAPTTDAEALCRMARKVLPGRFEWIMVSMGAQGGLLVSGTECCLAEVPDVPVMSTIGSGDSCVAGFCVGLSRGMPPRQAFALGMACGVANSMSDAVACVSPDDVRRLLSQIMLSDPKQYSIETKGGPL
ncbi:MAG TPA: 1-phosphofructokinase family hexose kinase [Candidatus Fournierella pullicola]|uniref:Tagatose-6-phosphate kinase n=1 Tax=Candidatus Allofournierella pullicola TaxID=2838596 RepID=A0A9D1V4U8_9FIRM|nr:1-phosphofructokinase family hexose kinase [Candidatus Fournierella pullicola]